ncbi:MAG: hypothetical protein IKL56_06170 [Bacteroidaceae bacterium]|nr:hypothetical protein [Bacteroidaceae bacterium]
MEKGDILIDKIKFVKFHKEERIIQGNTYGQYSSCYIAYLSEHSNSIVVIDELAEKKHPEWKKKTINRAEILSQELAGESIKFKIVEMFTDGAFEGEITK